MMKKLIAVLSALLLCALTAGCAERFTLPDSAAEEAAGDEAEPEDRDETEAAPGTEPEETEESAEESAEAEPEPDTQPSYKPTEAVSYSDAGIPIANAFYALRLPADWDGHYLCETSYAGDVMLLRFRHRESADAGMGGTLFLLALAPEGNDYSAASQKQLHTLSDGDETYTLFRVDPTDVQFSEETAEQYAAMRQQIDGILDTLEPAEGFRF